MKQDADKIVEYIQKGMEQEQDVEKRENEQK
jgi:hypothetical protein